MGEPLTDEEKQAAAEEVIEKFSVSTENDAVTARRDPAAYRAMMIERLDQLNKGLAQNTKALILLVKHLQKKGAPKGDQS